jgi:hypothetical protein
MKKIFKTTIKILLSGTIAAATLFSSAVTVKAAAPVTQNALAENKTFIPFRSDLVKYITSCAHESNTVIQSQWFRLFKEETSTPGWSKTYYGDYTDSTGVTRSSQNVQVTYNASFDPFLYATITSNSDFISNWIRNVPTVFDGYCINYKTHPVFCDGLVELTKNGYMLGGGYRQANNIFEYGFAQRDYWDIRVLAILAHNWNNLTATQQNWCKTYLSYLVNDYVSRGAAAIASKNNNVALYNLMSISNEGFYSAKGQEFFSYANSDSTVSIGQLFKNIMVANGRTGHIRTADVYTEVNLNGLFAGNANCNYTGNSLGDGDYDWFAYNVCFSGDAVWSRIRAFVDGDASGSVLKKEWLLRYYASHGSNGSVNAISEAIAKQGETVKEKAGSVVLPGCNKENRSRSTPGFYCYGHDATGEATVSKPAGVEYIAFGSDGGRGYKWRITDNSTGTVISENMESYSPSPKIKLDARYIWSNNISVYVQTYFHDDGGNVGIGACYASTKNTYVNWTYVVLNQCETSGHRYEYTYSFNADHSQCTAYGVCAGCGDRKNYIDGTITKTQDSRFYYYTADFAHTPVAARTYTVSKTTGTFTFKPGNTAISGTTHDEQSISQRCSGEGFELHTAVSGRCSLAAGNIKPGAKYVTISASGSENCFTVYNKRGKELRTITLLNESQGETKYTFDLTSLSDADLDGAYVVVNMMSRSTFSSGMTIGQIANCTSKINLNYITVKY